MIEFLILFLSLALLGIFVCVLFYLNTDDKNAPEPYKPIKDHLDEHIEKNTEAIKRIDKQIEANKIDKNTSASDISAMFNSTSRN